jgi:hypothetical protein
MSAPVCVRSLSGFLFTWPDLPFEISIARIRESPRGTSSELEIFYRNGTGKAKTLTHQSFNLLTSKTRLAADMKRQHDAPWVSMLEQVSVLTLRALREGEPIESLTPSLDDQQAWFVLNPLLYDKNSTVLYGPGDSLKSMLALYCGLLLASGRSGTHLDCAPTPWKVLFLDWEMSVRDVRGRVKLLQAGDPRLTSVPDYRRCFQPLADEADALKKVIADAQYDILIIDSLAMAAGGQELERADSAIRFNSALRGLNCTSLVIGHTPKPQEDQKQRSLYGSVFFANLCRIAWEVRREGNTIGLYQRKNNLGRAHDPLGFSIETTDESCCITPADLFEEPTLAAGMPVQEQLAKALLTKQGQTLEELAQLTGEKKATIKSKLYRYKKRFMQIDGKWECLA